MAGNFEEKKKLVKIILPLYAHNEMSTVYKSIYVYFTL